MKELQIRRDLELGKQHGKEFIKWSRKENDFVDFDLIDRFMEMADSNYEIADFELLDKDEMWEILTEWKPTGLRRSKSTKGKKIEWHHMGRDGKEHIYTRPYTAKAIMSVFDAVTHGDTLE